MNIYANKADKQGKIKFLLLNELSPNLLNFLGFQGLLYFWSTVLYNLPLIACFNLSLMNQCGLFNIMIFTCTLSSDQPLKVTTFAENYFFLVLLILLSWIIPILIFWALLNEFIHCFHLWELYRLPFCFQLTLIFSGRKTLLTNIELET